MSQQRHTEDQVIAQLRRGGVLLGKGVQVPDVCKQLERSLSRPITAGGRSMVVARQRWPSNLRLSRKRMLG